MVRKAELDKMDLPEIPEEAITSELSEEGPAETTEIKPGWFASRGRRFKLGLFGVIGCLLVSGIGLAIWGAVGLYQDRKAALTREKAAASQALATAEASRLVFKDFLIPLPEGNGSRVLMINFIAEMGKKRKQINLNGNAGVRRQVMKAIQLRGNDLLDSIQNREVLKKDLINLMNQILGEGTVKDIYLTDFALI
ncbi:MAG: flagellar basal body-associated FliL family protein [Syntrophaceae bacterium]|nr:flagellar basal body-associated FliL family protein [Syntrophaceae bacterium]